MRERKGGRMMDEMDELRKTMHSHQGGMKKESIKHAHKYCSYHPYPS